MPFEGVNPFLGNLPLVLDLHVAAQKAGTGISPQTRWFVRQAVAVLRPEEVDAAQGLARIFAILRHSRQAGETLRDLHRGGVLRLLVPDLGLIDCHSQHDIYHVYTTDEHTLRVLERLAELPQTTDSLLESWRQELERIEDREVLYLAALYHDIGKGLGAEHSDSGARLVRQFAHGLGWSEARVAQAADLVQYHLLLNYIAQRRDLEDEKTVRDLLARIQDEHLLRKLYVLTYADISSVHPDAWSAWKATLLQQLYEAASRELTDESGFRQDSQARRVELVQAVQGIEDETVLHHLEMLPRRYASSVSPAQVAQHLELIGALAGGRKVAVGVSDHGSHFDVAVASVDRSGLLARICAGITTRHLSIVSAQVYTRKDGVVIDLFSVLDLDGTRTLDAEVLARDLEEGIAQVWEMEGTQVRALVGSYVKRWSMSFQRIMTPRAHVRFSDGASDDFSVLDITCADCLGLLFQLTLRIAEQGWVIHAARISTEADRALDSFYLTDGFGRRIPDDEVRQMACRSLLQGLESCS